MPLPLYSEQKPSSTIRHIIAIASGKGGVGKSTVTVNLARSLNQQGFSVGILDADIHGPSIRKMITEHQLPYQEHGVLFPAIAEGMKIMSMAYFRKEQESAAFRAPIVTSMIVQFLKEVSWGELDFMLIDFPPGTGDVQLTISQQTEISGALLVTTPQEISVIDVRKAIDLFNKVHIPILGIIENMSFYMPPGSLEKRYLFGSGGAARLADVTSNKLLAQLPIIPLLCECADAGTSIFEIDNAGEAVQVFTALAQKVLCEIAASADVLVKEIQQLDRDTLKVTWTDNSEKIVRFKDVQKLCPCVRCQGSGKADDAVFAHSVTQVGHYALKVKFSSGCSLGLYPIDLLKKLF